MSLPLVLLPGMMCDARLFGPQIAAVSGRRPVMTFGLGDSDRMPDLAAGILSRAPPRFALAGLSMGGIVAMEILRQAPDRVDRLALLDTNPLAEAAEVKARRARQMQAVADGRLRAVLRDEMKPSYLAEGPGRQRILDLCMEMALALGPEVFARQSRALRDRIDQCETLRSHAGPALVLCGAQDRLCPPDRHRLMHGLLRDASLCILPGAGHLPTLEAPEATNAALAAWLNRP